MSGTGTETLTAALRRLADEHASGLLSVHTPERDVVLELADGVPVGIGPVLDVGERVGRDADASLVAAAVVDTLVDRTVAAIVGGGGDWEWDVSSSATTMPVPPGLATELSRRAVDAAQALARLQGATVLLPGRDFPTHGEVGRIAAVFDGERTLDEVAAATGLTLAAVATHAAALVRAGVLSTGLEDLAPRSWSDAVRDAAEDEDEDEPELWVMDDPPPPVEEPDLEGSAAEEPVVDEPTVDEPVVDEPTVGEPAVVDEATSVASEDDDEPFVVPAAQTAADDTGWADTGWLDELDDDDVAPTLPDGDGEHDDARAALTSMLGELHGSPPDAAPAEEAPARGRYDRPTDEDDDDERERPAAGSQRREARAEPGEVAEFLRELSRLALDED